MTNLTESPVYEPGIFQLEKTTPPLGGAPAFNGSNPSAGHANVQALQLANRTAWLKEQVGAGGSVLPEPDKIPRADADGKIAEDWLPEDLLVNAKTMQDYPAIRAYTGKATGIRLTRPGIAGSFYRDDEDTTSADIAGVVLIDGLERRWKRLFDGNVNVLWSGAKFDGVTDDTVAIQNSINYVYSKGGGTVDCPAGTAIVSAARISLPILLVSLDGTTHVTDTRYQACVIMRAGVKLVGKGHTNTTIWAKDNTTLVAVSLYNMVGGGVTNLAIRGGKGLQTHVSDFDQPMMGLDISYLEIYDSAGYGLGMQAGLYINNRAKNLWIHDCWQDGIDWKSKSRASDGALSYGNSIDTVLCERFGQDIDVESAGFDLRGNLQVSNIVARDFYVEGRNNLGIRFSPGVLRLNEHRIPSDRSTLSNFYIDSGNPAGAGSQGLSIYSAESIVVTNGVIRNCKDYGVFVNYSGAGNSRGNFANITNVNVIGTRGSAFATTCPWTSFTGCKEIPFEARFAVEIGTLVAGQTVLKVTDTFDPAVVTVTKNGVPLVKGTDFTITGSDTVTLTTAATAADIYVVGSPTAIGFDVRSGSLETSTATNALVVGCTTASAIIPVKVASVCLPTFSQNANNFSGLGQIRTSMSGNFLEAIGPALDINFEIFPKGAGNTTLRSRGSRSFVATNPASAVNWVEVSGSASGNGVSIYPSGSDANTPLRLQAKGTSPITMVSIVSLRGMAFSEIPAAAANNGSTVRVTDRSNRFATSDGTNWRWQDGNIAS